MHRQRLVKAHAQSSENQRINGTFFFFFPSHLQLSFSLVQGSMSMPRTSFHCLSPRCYIPSRSSSRLRIGNLDYRFAPERKWRGAALLPIFFFLSQRSQTRILVEVWGKRCFLLLMRWALTWISWLMHHQELSSRRSAMTTSANCRS